MDIAPIPISIPGDDLGLPGLTPESTPSEVDISHLSGAEKAAIVVRLMAEAGGGLSLRPLPERMQAALVRTVGSLGPIPEEVVRAVAAEFAEAVEDARTNGPGGMAHAIDLLEGSVSAGVAERLRKQSGVASGLDPWDRIAEQEAEDLLPVIEAESVEVAAVILSKLGVSKAASLLGMMPGERARRITYAVSLISDIQPPVVQTIGAAIAGVLSIEPPRAFSDGPVERVGAILNTSRAQTRNEVLEGLDEEDPAFAESVRKAIFTFANIPDRIDPRDVPKILRQVDQAVVAQALAGAVDDLERVKDFIVGAIPQRMAKNIMEEVAELGEVDPDDSENAMSQVVAAIRRMESEGEIYLVAGDG